MPKNKGKLFAVLLILALSITAAYYLSGHSMQNNLFNSDYLYLPTLFSDLFSKDGELKNWLLTPAPYFFPDYPLFYIAYLVGSNPYSQIIIFALLQAILTLGAVWLLAKQISNANAFFASIVILIAIIWLALNSFEPFIFILNSAGHFGIFLASIVFIVFWLKIIEESTEVPLFVSLMGILAFISTLSDNLFLIQVIAPLIATHIVVSTAKRDFLMKRMIALIFVTICSVFGSISYRWLIANHTRYHVSIGFDQFMSHLKDLQVLLSSAIVGNPVFGAIFLLYCALVLHSFFVLVRNGREVGKLSWVAIFSFFSFFTTLGAASLVTNLPITVRYLIPTLFWPVIIVFIYFSRLLKDVFFHAGAIISLLAISSLCWGYYPLFKKNGILTHYYPSDLACIDEVLEKEGIANGIAQYWDAKYIQNFSRLNLNIAQHLENLGEMHWITSKKYFKQTYDFAILSEAAASPYRISSENLKLLNGVPKSVTICGGRSVYVYGKDKLRVR